MTSSPPPNRPHRTRADQIARVLRRRLAKGHYGIGACLPPERELAQELGTSRTTVAAALAHLSELGFVERRQGRGTWVKPPPKQAIALVHTFNASGYPIWPEAVGLLQGALESLKQSGLTTIDILRGSLTVDLDELRQVAGLLLLQIDERCEPVVRELLARGMPCVVANLSMEWMHLPASIVKHREVSARATQLLIDMGHRRIGFIGNAPESFFYHASRGGYAQAMRDAALPIDERWIVMQPGAMALIGYLGARRILSLDPRPTALVAARDGYAEGICCAAAELGLVIGRDLSVIGYDNMTWGTGQEFLTTFQHPSLETARAAAQMLIQWLFTGERPANIEVDAPLVMRRSIAPIASQPVAFPGAEILSVV